MKKLLTIISLLAIATLTYAQNSTIAVPAPKTMNIGEGNEWIPLFIQGVITTNFQNYSGMKVVDRQNSDMVKAEQRLSENAEFSDADAIEMGKMTHAHLIVTGSITGKASSYALMFSITDAETGETKASATVPNCLFSALENGDAANQISYDLMTGYGISLSADAKKKLTQKASVMTAENTAQASVAKGIVAENSGSNIEALTYYIQAKKNDKKLSEATSRMANMSTVVSTGNFGKNAKNMIKLRNDWDKLLTEAAEFIKANPPTFDLYYFTDIDVKEMTERDYINGTMTFIVSHPYFVWNNREEYLENKKVADDLLNGLHKIDQSKNWGDKINKFPWSYIRNDEDYVYTINLLDAKKKNIAKIDKTLRVYCREDWDINTYLYNGSGPWRDEIDFSDLSIEFKDISVNDADTDKLFIDVSLSEKSKNVLSVQPAPSDVLPFTKAIEALKTGRHGEIIKTPHYCTPDFGHYRFSGCQVYYNRLLPLDLLERYRFDSEQVYDNIIERERQRKDDIKYNWAKMFKLIFDSNIRVLVDFVDVNYDSVECPMEIYWTYIPNQRTELYCGTYVYQGDKSVKEIIIPFGYQMIDFKSLKGLKNLEAILIPRSINSIDLKGLKQIKNVKKLYMGTEKEWQNITHHPYQVYGVYACTSLYGR